MSRETPARRRPGNTARKAGHLREPIAAPTRRPAGPAGAAASAASAASAGAAAEALADWAPTAGRILLGAVLAWFGYHELVQPAPWTGYVPVAGSGSNAAILLVLAHGWLLLVLAAALVAGIAPRAAAAIAALLLLEIVVWLAISGGLSDLVARDAGVLGLAVCLTGCRHHRAVLSR